MPDIKHVPTVACLTCGRQIVITETTDTSYRATCARCDVIWEFVRAGEVQACAYCGWTEQLPAAMVNLQQHIAQCELHPMAQLREENELLRTGLYDIIQSNSGAPSQLLDDLRKLHGTRLCTKTDAA